MQFNPAAIHDTMDYRRGCVHVSGTAPLCDNRTVEDAGCSHYNRCKRCRARQTHWYRLWI